MTDSLQKKIDFAIKLLRAIPQDNGPIEISFSGGKDSEVILELAKRAGITYRAIYKNTTVDPPGTIAHCKSKGVEVLNPKKTFFELMRQKGAPTRWSRFCCEHLKEYKVLDRAVQGVRRCESAKRAERYHEPEICRTYPKGEKARIYLPILEWTNADVAEFINERAIKCHSLYYDEGGYFTPREDWDVSHVRWLHKDSAESSLWDIPNYSKRGLSTCRSSSTITQNRCVQKFAREAPTRVCFSDCSVRAANNSNL